MVLMVVRRGKRRQGSPPLGGRSRRFLRRIHQGTGAAACLEDLPCPPDQKGLRMERFAAMPVRRGRLARLAVVLSVAAVSC